MIKKVRIPQKVDNLLAFGVIVNFLISDLLCDYILSLFLKVLTSVLHNEMFSGRQLQQDVKFHGRFWIQLRSHLQGVQVVW
jgi:hypothetical protein